MYERVVVGLLRIMVRLPCYHSDVLSGVILKQITYTDNSAAGGWTVGCQSKSQGTRYRLGLTVYDIVAVKIFQRYRDIAISPYRFEP